MAFPLLQPPRRPRVFKDRRTPIESYYRTQFRFYEYSVQWIADTFLGPDNGETRGGALSNKQKVEIALRYMADPGFQNGVSEVVGVSQPTVSRTVHEVVDAICNQTAAWIQFPSTTVDIENASRKWEHTRRFPLAFGVVDGTLIKVQKPFRRYTPQEYFSGRKKFYCINVQIICDQDCKILDVYAAWPGSVHDARVWRNSPVRALMETGIARDKLLIADSAYGITPYMMTPYPAREAAADPVKGNFNDVLVRDRVLVEDTLGQLKSRFQMLRVPIRIQLESVPKFVLACCILHNVGKYLDDNFEDDKEDDPDENEDSDPEETYMPTTAGASRLAGQQKRDQIANALLTQPAPSRS